MKRTIAITMVLTFAALTASAQRGPGGPRRGPGRTGPSGLEYPPLAKTEAEKKILTTLDEIVKAGELHANVPAADGRMLRLLVEGLNAKNVVEIGTSTGVSGLWFCMALQETGGKLNTFELDAERAATARAHFKKAGVDGLVNLVEGDAHQNIAKLKAPVDVVFIDAEKEGYVDYLNKMLPLVRQGGLILAHNVDSLRDYLKAVNSNPDLETVLFMDGGGLAITLKKR